MSIASDASAKEGACINRNKDAAWNFLAETDVPKLYISARDGDLEEADCKEANFLDERILKLKIEIIKMPMPNPTRASFLLFR